MPFAPFLVLCGLRCFVFAMYLSTINSPVLLLLCPTTRRSLYFYFLQEPRRRVFPRLEMSEQKPNENFKRQEIGIKTGTITNKPYLCCVQSRAKKKEKKEQYCRNFAHVSPGYLTSGAESRRPAY